MAECIVAAAIKHPDGEIYALPAPMRHHHIIHMMYDDNGRNGEGGENCDNQGFLTSYGRFVDRDEAGRIAIAAGQLPLVRDTEHHLFSEDLW